MDINYIVSKEELLDLLESYYRLAALESGGVDNWDWYGASLNDFLKEYIEENKTLLLERIEEEEIEDFGFREIAEFELDNYEEVQGSEYVEGANPQI